MQLRLAWSHRQKEPCGVVEVLWRFPPVAALAHSECRMLLRINEFFGVGVHKSARPLQWPVDGPSRHRLHSPWQGCAAR